MNLSKADKYYSEACVEEDVNFEMSIKLWEKNMSREARGSRSRGNSLVESYEVSLACWDC